MNKWEMKPLGQLCLIERGGSPRPIDKYITDSPDGINWIKIGDTTESMYITNTKEKIIPEGMKKSRYVQRGDFLLSNSMSFGRPYILDIDGCIHDGWLVIRDTSNLFDKRFLYYFLGSPNTYQKFKSMAVGGVVNNLNIDMVKKVEVPVLSMSEQKEIADSLDKVTALISSRKAQLEKLDLLVKSRFIEMFGDPVINPKSWEIAPLSSLIVTANNGMARRGKDNDGSIVLRLVELQNGYIDYAEPNRISLTEAEEKRYRLKENDFLFARVNGNPDYVGRCAVFNEISEPVYHNDHIIRVHFDENKINGCFTSVLLNSDYGKRQMREQIKTSAGQYTISQDGIGGIMTILPPLDLQNEFATFVEQTDKLKFEVKEALEKLETLKKSLMQQYFG